MSFCDFFWWRSMFCSTTSSFLRSSFTCCSLTRSLEDSSCIAPVGSGGGGASLLNMFFFCSSVMGKCLYSLKQRYFNKKKQSILSLRDSIRVVKDLEGLVLCKQKRVYEWFAVIM